MIGLRVTVPIACWRKGAARELLETEPVPSPATCYGALLSFVGETDRDRHRGCRISAGLLNVPGRSAVLRSLWRIKKRNLQQGNGENARPDFQQLVIGAELMLWCDSSEETESVESLEARVRRASLEPETVDRFGGWSLGESTHLINDAWFHEDGAPPRRCRAFLTDPEGDTTLPVWVDHVGSSGTRYALGRLTSIDGRPDPNRLPQIPPHALAR